MRRPNLGRTLIAAVFSLLVASLVLVGTAPASAQSGANAQGIPQRIAALEQQVRALDLQVAGLGEQLNALGGSTPTFGARVLRIVDANGTEVGPMISRSEVVRKIDGFWLVLSVGTSGFAEFSPLFLSDEFDCSGKLYLADSPDLVRQALIVKGTAYYSNGNPKSVGVKAYYSLFAGGGSFCQPFDQAYEQYVSEVAKSDLSAFVPPFTVRYDQ